MKKFLCGLAAGLSLWSAGAADLHWQTDLPRALAQAQGEKKLVFMDFTGSDWCESCQILSQKIFSQPEFAAYAKTNLVLVEVDFPEKTPQSDALKAANLALAKKMGVEGYPTLIALTPDGKVAWRYDGIPDGGPQGLIKKLTDAHKS